MEGKGGRTQDNIPKHIARWWPTTGRTWPDAWTWRRSRRSTWTRWCASTSAWTRWCASTGAWTRWPTTRRTTWADTWTGGCSRRRTHSAYGVNMDTNTAPGVAHIDPAWSFDRCTPRWSGDGEHTGT